MPVGCTKVALCSSHSTKYMVERYKDKCSVTSCKRVGSKFQHGVLWCAEHEPWTALRTSTPPSRRSRSRSRVRAHVVDDEEPEDTSPTRRWRRTMSNLETLFVESRRSGRGGLRSIDALQDLQGILQRAPLSAGWPSRAPSPRSVGRRTDDAAGRTSEALDCRGGDGASPRPERAYPLPDYMALRAQEDRANRARVRSQWMERGGWGSSSFPSEFPPKTGHVLPKNEACFSQKWSMFFPKVFPQNVYFS